MRILLIDIDTLRPDHLGCYGYRRNTSPNIDSIAAEGVRFDNYYCPNAPCLPSRASLISGRYGIHTGVVGHGGTSADMWLQGESRGFHDCTSDHNLISLFRKKGLYCASVSTFAERHSAWWFNAGFNECVNMGKGGVESAEEITPDAVDWLTRKGTRDNWLLHVHYWDPHTPYRAPAELGNPFENEPLDDDWITDELFEEHKRHVGPHSAYTINMWNDKTNPRFPRQPGRVDSLADVKKLIDNYDTGVKYADDNVGILLDTLRKLGIYDDVNIIVTSDHGENLGELGIYSEHGTADEATCRIPMIIKWNGGKKGIADKELHTNVDLAPTIEDLLGIQNKCERFDGESYAAFITDGQSKKREAVVLTQCAHVCQRSVRFDHYIYIRTYHGGLHLFPEEMLFDLDNDKHQTQNIAESNPELCGRGARYLEKWVADMMRSSDYAADPLWVVMKEGGPFHAKGQKKYYTDSLREQGREADAAAIEKLYPEFD